MSAFDWPVYVQEVYPPMPLLPAFRPTGSPESVACSSCGAAIGAPCVFGTRAQGLTAREHGTHKVRAWQANKAARHLVAALAECAACAAPIPKAERACPIHEGLLVAVETALRASLSDAPKFVAPSLRDDLARHLAPAAARAAWRLQFPPVHPQEAR